MINFLYPTFLIMVGSLWYHSVRCSSLYNTYFDLIIKKLNNKVLSEPIIINHINNNKR